MSLASAWVIDLLSYSTRFFFCNNPHSAFLASWSFEQLAYRFAGQGHGFLDYGLNQREGLFAPDLTESKSERAVKVNIQIMRTFTKWSCS